MGDKLIIKKIAIEEFAKGMKILKCDKSWLNLKIYESNMNECEIIDILKKYGVKEIVVKVDELFEDNLKHKKVPDNNKGDNNNVIDKRLCSFIISDLYFLENEYPKLKNQVKRLFSNISKNNFNYDELADITGRILNNTLKNTPFVLNISKYNQNEDEYLYNHSLNVAFLANLIGRNLGYNIQKVEELSLSALLHDIGKLFLDKTILNKPGKLTEQEFAEIKKHPILGYQFLYSQGSFPKNVLLGVLDHHEKENGQGYPRGLKNEEISTFAKIIGILDMYDAITNDTCYREALDNESAIKLLRSYEGTFYSKRLVNFISKLIQYKSMGTVVELDTKEIAIVIKYQKDVQSPIVLIVKDKDRFLDTPILFDLNSYNVKTGKSYKRIVRTLKKSEIDFNPAEILFSFFGEDKILKING